MNLLLIDTVVIINLVHQLSHEIDIIIASKSIASSTLIQSLAAVITVACSLGGAGGGHASITDVPTCPAIGVSLSPVVRHAFWKDNDGTVSLPLCDIWLVSQVVTPPMEPVNDRVLFFWVVVFWHVNLISPINSL